MPPNRCYLCCIPGARVADSLEVGQVAREVARSADQPDGVAPVVAVKQVAAEPQRINPNNPQRRTREPGARNGELPPDPDLALQAQGRVAGDGAIPAPERFDHGRAWRGAIGQGQERIGQRIERVLAAPGEHEDHDGAREAESPIKRLERHAADEQILLPGQHRDRWVRDVGRRLGLRTAEVGIGLSAPAFRELNAPLGEPYAPIGGLDRRSEQAAARRRNGQLRPSQSEVSAASPAPAGTGRFERASR